MSQDSSPAFMPGYDVDRDEFYRRLHQLLQNKTGANAFILTAARYTRLLQQVKDARNKIKKSPADYRRIKRYDIIITPKGEKLVMANADGNKTRQLFVEMEEIYEIIRDFHLNMNHAGRTRLMYAIKPKYKNITTEMVMLYLTLCDGCKDKVVKRSRIYKTDIIQNTLTDPLESENQDSVLDNGAENIDDTKIYPELFSRGQLDILDVTTVSRDDFKYLFVYRNFVTKFIHLKALNSININDNVDALLEIFLIFGAPNILQSKNGLSVTKQICRRMYSIFPDIKVVAGDATQDNYNFVGQSNEDILKLLCDWYRDNMSQMWYNGIKYVQHILNNTFNVDIYRTPSECVFGYNPKRGIATFMAKDVYEHLVTEEDLKMAIRDKISGKKSDHTQLGESLIPSCDFVKMEKNIDDDDEMDSDDDTLHIEIKE